jgi:hypothetical protein
MIMDAHIFCHKIFIFFNKTYNIIFKYLSTWCIITKLALQMLVVRVQIFLHKKIREMYVIKKNCSENSSHADLFR